MEIDQEIEALLDDNSDAISNSSDDLEDLLNCSDELLSDSFQLNVVSIDRLDKELAPDPQSTPDPPHAILPDPPIFPDPPHAILPDPPIVPDPPPILPDPVSPDTSPGPATSSGWPNNPPTRIVEYSESNGDQKPSKIIKLSNTGRYNHVKPLRVDSKKPSFITVPHRPSPWTKAGSHQVAPATYLPLEVETPPISATPTVTATATKVLAMKRFKTANQFSVSKYQPRSQLHVSSSITTTTGGCHGDPKVGVSSGIFGKKKVNFSLANKPPASFGLCHLRSTPTVKFNLTHLK